MEDEHVRGSQVMILKMEILILHTRNRFVYIFLLVEKTNNNYYDSSSTMYPKEGLSLYNFMNYSLHLCHSSSSLLIYLV